MEKILNFIMSLLILKQHQPITGVTRINSTNLFCLYDKKINSTNLFFLKKNSETGKIRRMIKHEELQKKNQENKKIRQKNKQKRREQKRTTTYPKERSGKRIFAT